MKASLQGLTFEWESALKWSCRELVVLVENDLSIRGSDAANFFVCGPLGAPTFRLPVLEGVENFPALSIPQPDVVLLKILGQNLPGHQDFGRGTPSDECRSGAVFQSKTIAALLKAINFSNYIRLKNRTFMKGLKLKKTQYSSKNLQKLKPQISILDNFN